MKKRTPFSARRIPLLAILAVCAALGSVIAMRYASNRVTRELLQITTPRQSAIITTQAQNSATNVPDPRLESEPAAEIEPEPTTAKPTTAPSTTKASSQTTAASTQKQAAALQNDSFILPVKETKVLKTYSPAALLFSETMGDWRTHDGVDFAAEAGSDVLSVGNGVVTKVVSDSRWGYIVEADYGTFTARYCGVTQDSAVKIDQTLHTGDVIGVLAVPPVESAEQSHLHFETLRDGVLADPLQALGKIR